MTSNILCFLTPGPIAILAILLVFGAPVFLVVWFVRHLSRGNKERQRLRLELARLADELEQVRKEAQAARKDTASGGSG